MILKVKDVVKQCVFSVLLLEKNQRTVLKNYYSGYVVISQAATRKGVDAGKDFEL